MHHINADREVGRLELAYDSINCADANVQLFPMLRAPAAPSARAELLAICMLRNLSIGTPQGMLTQVFG